MYRFLIIVATFLSAFLLFMIQPLYAKWLLPYFGGTSSVWTISIFFYSITLLLGYLYAALLISWRINQAFWVHLSLLAVAGVLLFTRFQETGSALLQPAIETFSPVWSILLTLCFAVGLPVLLLASTSVLAQYLYTRVTTKDPYPLYAVSNAGSLLGLLSYPIFFEPFTNVSTQASRWTFGFGLFALVFIIVWNMVRRLQNSTPRESVDRTQKILTNRFQIVLLAAVPTFFLASMTELLSQGIASFPLLWVVPLALYLISFIIAFNERTRLRLLSISSLLTFPLTFALLGLLPIMNTSALVYGLTFFVSMMFFFSLSVYFHRRLFDVRPGVKYLGKFYVWLTVGGALGSGVVGMVLPLVLNSQIEVILSVAAVALFLTKKELFNKTSIFKNHFSNIQQSVLQDILTIAAVVFLMVTVYVGFTVDSQRNFYGVLQIKDEVSIIDGEEYTIRSLINGATNHGSQVLSPEYEHKPRSYYGEDSGIGIAVGHASLPTNDVRLAVVGLGAGIMSTYCAGLQSIDYYEINPAVVDVAYDRFTYLDFCLEKTDIVLGDGRLSLEKAAADHNEKYDVIMIDAFTDDAIPVHLLTNEAFVRAYEPMLAEDGVLAFHVSNRYLNLLPPIAGLANANGYEILEVFYRPENNSGADLPSHWVLFARPEVILKLESYERTKRYSGKQFLWTDENNSVLNVLSFKGSSSGRE